MGVKQTNRHKHASAEKVKEMTKEAKGTKRDTEFLFDEEEEVIAPRKGRKSTTTTGEPKKPRNMALAVQELQDKLAHMGDKLQENIQRLGHHAVCMQFMCSFFFERISFLGVAPTKNPTSGGTALKRQRHRMLVLQQPSTALAASH